MVTHICTCTVHTGYSVVSPWAMAAASFQPVKKYLFIPAKLSAPCPQIQAKHKYISVLLSAFFSRASNFPIRINKSHDWLFTWSDTDRAASHSLPTILASASTISSLQCQLSVLRDFSGILSAPSGAWWNKLRLTHGRWSRNIPEKGLISVRKHHTKPPCRIPSARILKLGILELNCVKQEWLDREACSSTTLWRSFR